MFSLPQPVAPRKLSNVSSDDLSTNEEGIVLPYLAGSGKIALKWITTFYNLRKVQSGGGGGKGGKGGSAGAQQDNWCADIAGVANICPDGAPNDALLWVTVNDELAFSGPLFRTPGQNYAAFTLDTYCQQAWCRWGTSDGIAAGNSLVLYPRQDAVPEGVDPTRISTWPPLDADGNPVVGDDPIPGVINPLSGHYQFHPRYRWQAIFEFKSFFLGSSPNMPTVVVALARGCKFFAGARFEATTAGVNPMGPAYELVVDDLIGAGMVESLLNADSFVETGSNLDHAGILLAPVLTDPKPLNAFFADYFEYFDGFARRNGDLLEMGYFAHGPDIDESSLHTLDEDDFAGEEPQITPGTLEDTRNYFDVTFTDSVRFFGKGTASFRHLENFGKVKKRRPDRQQRPFIIDTDLAQRFITERGVMRGAVSPGAGSAPFLRDNVRDDLPGDLVVLDSGAIGLSMLMRILGKDVPGAGDGKTKLDYSVERADWDHLYTQPGTIKPPDFTIEAFKIKYQRIVELPSPLKDVAGIEIAVLAERPSPHIVGFRTWVSTDGVDYDHVERQSFFAVHAKVVDENYTGSTEVTDDTVGMVVELYGLDLGTIQSLSDPQRDDHTGLIWCGVEILSWGGITALGDGKYRVFTKRGCYGSSQSTHLIGAEVWFVFRDQLNPIAHASFLSQATDYFKFQTYTATENIELADITPVLHLFADGPFLLNNLELWGQGTDHEVRGRNPRYRWSLFDISGLGIVGEPGVAPAVFNAVTGLWYNLSVTGGIDSEVLHMAETGSATPPVAGAPSLFDTETGLWYPLTAAGTAPDMHLHLAQEAGTATPPSGGAPIVFNASNNISYRLVATGTGEEIGIHLLRLTAGRPFTPAPDVFATPAQPPPDYFVRFDLRMRDPVSGVTKWSGVTVVPEHIWSEEEWLIAIAGAFRHWIWGVSVLARLTDGSLWSSPWLEGDFFNNQSIGLGGEVTGGYDRIDVVLNRPTDLDFAGVAIWRSLRPDFTVEDELPDDVEFVHDGAELSFSILQPPGSTWYYRSAAYDAFSPTEHVTQAFIDDCGVNAGGAVPFTTLTLVPTLPPPAISPGSQNFSGTLNVSVMAAAGNVIRFTLDGTDVQPNSQEWPGGVGAYTTLALTQSCILHVRSYTADGAPSQQVIQSYTLDGTGGTCGAVTINPDFSQGLEGGDIALTCATSGGDTALHYRVNGGALTPYSAPFHIDLNDVVSDVYATKTGLAPGPPNFFDNTEIGGGGPLPLSPP